MRDYFAYPVATDRVWIRHTKSYWSLQTSRFLKRYRNGVFHFQKNYFDEGFTGFMASQDSVPWVRELNLAFGSYFLRKREEKNKPPYNPNAYLMSSFEICSLLTAL